ncbi:hypothetical protein [uncultured Maribacter sp.]|uniref:hypothetical protein n=1 Tax=uncultured Maribacter sp. TaxID=431308 RepID=UPI00262A7A2D|nr:hypothetical protein [uncultured Maribacter sp.]
MVSKSITSSTEKRMVEIMRLISKKGHYIPEKDIEKYYAINLLYTFKIIDYSYYIKEKNRIQVIIQGCNFTEAYCKKPKKFIHDQEWKLNPPLWLKSSKFINSQKFTITSIINVVFWIFFLLKKS